ncbi:MAG: cation:proton antiporter [Bacteroidetes bacterium]|nr:cation:proton antiporter [Bacteroidota bacterium]
MSLNEYLFYIIMPILSISLIFIFIRLLLGPEIVDRVIALDLIITCGLGIIATYSIITNQPTYLDIAMILALIAFLGTVAFSYFLIKQKKKDQND